MADPLLIPELEGARITFRRQPSSLSADLRPYWRVAILILSLKICCKGGKSNLQRLYVLNWAIRTSESREEFKEVISGRLSPEDVIVRFDPGLVRALDFAIGEGLVLRIGGDRVELSESGSRFADELSKSDLFDVERDFLATVRSGVTEAKVKALLAMDKL